MARVCDLVAVAVLCVLASCTMQSSAAASAAQQANNSRPNVLFLVVDDLRPELTAYRVKGVDLPTPNIDRLAAKALLFQHAYAQQAVCGPSRNSFMTGRRPDVTKTWNFIDNFREKGVGADWVTLPQHFKDNGYLVTGMGKLYHPNSPPHNDEPKSWSQNWTYYDPPAQIKGCRNNPTQGVHNITCTCTYTTKQEGADTATSSSMDTPPECVDYSLATHAIARLHELTHRPHPDWIVPQEFLDAVDSANISAPTHQLPPTGSPAEAFYSCNYLATHTDYQHQVGGIYADKPLPSDLVFKTRHAYYAGVLWLDYVVGLILDALDAAGVANSTIVSFHGDHGWQLGEHGIWCKQTNYELAARVPWMIADPRATRSHGSTETALVELVDLYKTLAELSGLPTPPGNVQGVSLAPLFTAPRPTAVGSAASLTGLQPALQYAFSQYPRCGSAPLPPSKAPWSNPCTKVERTEFATMGFSVRSAEWRYTEWRRWDGGKLAADWSSPPQAVELYSHAGDDGTDFNAFENVNVAGKAGNEGVEARLAEVLKTQFA